MADNSIFYLLKPLHTIRGAEAKKWIGRIVKSYDDPESKFTPLHTSSPDMRIISDDDGFSNVEAIINSATSSTALLADMLRFSHSSSGSNTVEIKAGRV